MMKNFRISNSEPLLAVTSHSQKPQKDGPWAKLKMPQKNDNKPLCDEQVTFLHNSPVNRSWEYST